MNNDLLKAIFPATLATPSDYEKQYPARSLPEGAMVTRFAPSPTGFMHVGGLYAAMISERLAHQSGGVFFLRIEDTDKKREVDDADKLIVQALARYGVRTDEGYVLGEPSSPTTSPLIERGSYGPYRQSVRKDIYAVYARELMLRGRAYPCFCTTEQLEEAHKKQELMKIRPGYYGEWAPCRTLSADEALDKIKSGMPYILRFRSEGNFDTKIKVFDMLKGDRELSQNDQDIVLIKSNGLPTYHLAHAVDDHLMRTTHVVRGDEWFSSTTLHIELFEALSFTPPTYGHILPIQKLEPREDGSGTTRRKLSKRKDPEASMDYYDQAGYPPQAVIEYLLNLANSTFEDWRKANPKLSDRDFTLSLDRLAHSNGALFDFVKLGNISKDVVARMTADELYTVSVEWARIHDTDLATHLEADPAYTRAIFGIERTGDFARKDIAKWSDIRAEIGFFFDDIFAALPDAPADALAAVDEATRRAAVDEFRTAFDLTDSKDVWLEKMRTLATKLGYAPDTKTFKTAPAGTYKGTIAEITKIFRILLTKRTQTPDLYQVIQVLGAERVLARIK